MRKIAVSLALGAVLIGSAQFAVAQVGGGLNLSRFVGGDATNTASTRLHLGASVPVFRIGPISLIPEIYYAQRGGDRQLASTIDDVVNPLAAFSLNYIEVPILLRMTVNLPGPFVTYFGGGPTFAWQLACGFSLVGLAMQGMSGNQDCSDPQLSSPGTVLANADRGVVGNAGLKLTMGPLGTVGVDLRVVQGLARVVEDQTGPFVRNQAVSMTLSYSLLDNGLIHIK